MDTVRLADPNAGPVQAVKDGGIDVTMRVPLRALECAEDTLGGIMDAELSERRCRGIEDGPGEEELRLLAGLFVAVANAIPMAPSNLITPWLSATDANALDDIVFWRIPQMDDEQLKELFASTLRDRDLDAIGLERIEEPVRRRRKAA